jgi:hypothetical protein
MLAGVSAVYYNVVERMETLLDVCNQNIISVPCDRVFETS